MQENSMQDCAKFNNPCGLGLALPLPERFDFAEALHLMRKGAAVARAGWNSQNQHIQIQHPTISSKMSVPYFFMTINQPRSTMDTEPQRVPWLASQTDLLAEDWFIVAPK